MMMTNGEDGDDDNEFMSFFNRQKGMKRNFSDTSDDDLVGFFSAKGIPWPIGIKLQLAA